MTRVLSVRHIASHLLRFSGSSAEGASLKQRAIRSSTWVISGDFFARLLQLANNLILTRLLMPEAYGLMSVVWVFLMGLEMFSDIGINTSIIQNRRGDDESFQNTAWTVQIVRGVCLWLASCALAWPVGWFYGDFRLTMLLPVAGLTTVVAGFGATSIGAHQRHLLQGRLTLMRLVSQILTIGITVLWAWAYHSAWALVAGALYGKLIHVVFSHLFLPGVRNRLAWDVSAFTELFQFGRWIFISTMLTFLANQLDKLIFSGVDLELGGVYWTAAMLASAPLQVVMTLNGKVVFPALSRKFEAGESLTHSFRRVRLPLLTLTAGIVIGLASCGNLIVQLLYTGSFEQAGPILQFLALGVWFQILEATNGSSLLAMAKANWVAAGNLGKLVGMAVFMSLGAWYFGIYGALGGLVIAEMMKYSVSVYAVRRHGLKSLGGDIRLSFYVLGMALLILALTHFLRQSMHQSVIVALAIGSPLAFLAWLPLLPTTLKLIKG